MKSNWKESRTLTQNIDTEASDALWSLSSDLHCFHSSTLSFSGSLSAWEIPILKLIVKMHKKKTAADATDKLHFIVEAIFIRNQTMFRNSVYDDSGKFCMFWCDSASTSKFQLFSNYSRSNPKFTIRDFMTRFIETFLTEEATSNFRTEWLASNYNIAFKS